MKLHPRYLFEDQLRLRTQHERAFKQRRSYKRCRAYFSEIAYSHNAARILNNEAEFYNNNNNNKNYNNNIFIKEKNNIFINIFIKKLNIIKKIMKVTIHIKL